MPLDESEWDDAEPMSDRITEVQEFLQDNPNRAYSSEELMYKFSRFSADGMTDEDELDWLIRQFHFIGEILVNQGDVEMRRGINEDEFATDKKPYFRTKQ